MHTLSPWSLRKAETRRVVKTAELAGRHPGRRRQSLPVAHCLAVLGETAWYLMEVLQVQFVLRCALQGIFCVVRATHIV